MNPLSTSTFAVDEANEEVVDLGRRFGGLERLYGAAGAAAIRGAHVAVIGIGGVVHFYMIVKSDVFYPIVFMVILFVLLAMRLYFRINKAT